MIRLRRSRQFTSTVGLVCVLMAGLLTAPLQTAAQVNDGVNLAPLWTLPVPQPTNSDIINQTAAVRLGKALFWDIQAGGDGQIACATCHFSAGADNRTLNTIHPGPNGIWEVVTGPGQEFPPQDFSVDDIVGSQGIVGSIFTGIDPDPSHGADFCTSNQTSPFYEHRRVTGRNTPPAVGAMYFRDNFWDGRANHRFNGLNPFGETGNAGGPPLGQVTENSSLASQAVGPPGSDTEMTCAGRTFNGPSSLGAKILARQPLQFQLVHQTDSVLGSVSAAPSNGLTLSYAQMIEDAFGPTLAADAVNSFSRIWGQAVQAYEATLIPDRTPFDFYLAGNNSALTESQQRGLNRFTGKGGCVHCHAGPMLSDATTAFYATKGAENEDGGDQGYHNIGVKPTADDLGRASLGPNGISFQELNNSFNRGAFKTPHLRNLKLTAPYFHDGSHPNLALVVEFYNNGGDAQNPELADRIKPLSLDAQDQAELVDFLENALLDCRVEKEQAPFDHPFLPLPNGAARPAVGAAGTGACAAQQLALSVLAAGNGSGTVGPVAAGTSAFFDVGAVVSLTAAPAAGSAFTGWSGGGCTGTGTCTVTMNAATSVTATFETIKAALSSPAPGSVLPGPSTTFTWSAGSGATEYILWVGTTAGRNNLYSKSLGLNLSGTVNYLPTSGGQVYVRLLTRVSTGLLFTDYTFTAATYSKAVLTSHTSGSTLAGPSATFTWSEGTGATEYILWVGTTAGRNNLYSKSQGLNSSVTVNKLPTNGSQVYVRLLTRIASGLMFTDYTFTTATISQAALVSPTPENPLTEASATFTWSAGTDATEYILWVGTTAGHNQLYSKSLGLNQSATVKNLPINGSPVYVRLLTRIASGLMFTDYSFTTAP